MPWFSYSAKHEFYHFLCRTVVRVRNKCETSVASNIWHVLSKCHCDDDDDDVVLLLHLLSLCMTCKHIYYHGFSNDPTGMNVGKNY